MFSRFKYSQLLRIFEFGIKKMWWFSWQYNFFNMRSRKKHSLQFSQYKRFNSYIKLFHISIVSRAVASRNTYIAEVQYRVQRAAARFGKLVSHVLTQWCFSRRGRVGSSLTSFAYREKDCRVLLRATMGREGVVPVNRNPR